MHDMMLQLVGDSTRLAEAMRKRDYTEAFPLLPRLFSWLTTMVTQVAEENATYDLLGNGKSLSALVPARRPTARGEREVQS
jgi:hypothetical protein